MGGIMKRIIPLSICFLLSSALPGVSQEPAVCEKTVSEKITKIMPELIRIRRQIHQNPELGNREFKTAALVAKELSKLGLAVKEKIAHTGVVVV